MPDHPDQHQSASVNSQTGLWCCYVANCGGKGNLITLAAESQYGGNKDDARDWIRTRYGIGSSGPRQREQKQIPQEEIDGTHKALVEQAKVTLEMLQVERGLSLEVIRRYQLGREKTGRVTIPIRDAHGHVANIRRWMPPSQRKSSTPKVIHVKGFGGTRWFPFDVLQQNELIVFCAGELDALCAQSNGIPAVTVTAGEGKLDEEQMVQARDAGVKGFYVCFDNDEPGRSGAEKVTKRLHDFGFRVYNVTLPEDVGASGDITDYFVGLDASGGDFRQLMNDAPLYEPPDEVSRDDAVYPVTLNEALNPFYHGKRVEVNILISGRTDRTYLYPTQPHVRCAFENWTGSGHPRFCPPDCEQLNHNGNRTIDIPTEDRAGLKLIKVNDQAQANEIRTLFGITGNCGRWEWTAEQSGAISEVVVRPIIHNVNEVMQNIALNTFFEGHNLLGNNRYELIGRVWPTPWRQETTLILSEAKPLQADVGGFEMTDELREELKIFQPDEVTLESLEKRLNHIWDEFGDHAFAMRIVGRRDLISLMDLVYHSALYIQFGSTEPIKGWMNAFVIGDTGSAKSEIAEGFVRWLGLGERVAFENASTVGITIATKQLPSGAWYSEWGALCLNDRRLVILDEIGEKADDLELLTDVLSSGVVKTAKVEKDESYARTRIIVLTNPRKGTPQYMAQYDFGIQAVRRFFRKAEDIRRYDMALTVALEEVDSDSINEKGSLTGSCAYPRELCRQLVLWGWTREPHHIQYEDGAEDQILSDARALSSAYLSDVPLVSASDMRLKLARLATSIAIRTFSTSDGEHVTVTAAHAQAAANLLCTFYDKDGMRYGEYAQRFQSEMMLNPEQVDRAMRAVSRALINNDEFGEMDMMELDSLQHFVTFMQGDTIFRLAQLQQSLNMEKERAQSLVAMMTQHRLVNPVSRGYARTAACVRVIGAMRRAINSAQEQREEI